MKSDESLPHGVAALKDGLWLALVAALLAMSFYALAPSSTGAHYVQYRCAADLLLRGKNPYGFDTQVEHQRALWAGHECSFLPFYYPPWLALACVPLSLFPFPIARAVFLYLTSLCLVLAGSLLHSAAPGLSRGGSIVLVAGFLPSLVAAQTGQTAPVVLLLLTLTWIALDRGHDKVAGTALAALTIKPQLSVAVIIGTLVWAARRRRWGLIGAFLATLAIFCLASTALFPAWPMAMLEAPGLIPLPTQTRPEVGVTWPLLLRTFGLAHLPHAAAYAALAIPASTWVVLSAWHRDTRAGDMIGRGSIAAFAIAPYAQFYDLPVLLVPLFDLMGHRKPSPLVFTLMLAFIVLPYLNFLALGMAGWPPCTFAWVPATLAVAWFWRDWGSKESEGLCGCEP